MGYRPHGLDLPAWKAAVLSQYTDETNKEEWEAIWSFVMLSLFFHVDNRKLKYDETGFKGSFREIANYLIDIISKV